MENKFTLFLGRRRQYPLNGSVEANLTASIIVVILTVDCLQKDINVTLTRIFRSGITSPFCYPSRNFIPPEIP